jgi:hypothetical protein
MLKLLLQALSGWLLAVGLMEIVTSWEAPGASSTFWKPTKRFGGWAKPTELAPAGSVR